MIDGVEIFRDPRYNVAHWNLPERDPATWKPVRR